MHSALAASTSFCPLCSWRTVFLVLTQGFFACFGQACSSPSARGCSDRLHKSNPEHVFDLGENLNICSPAYSCLPLNEILHNVASSLHRKHNHTVFPQLLHPSHNSAPALVSVCFVKHSTMWRNDQFCCLDPVGQALKMERASKSRQMTPSINVVQHCSADQGWSINHISSEWLQKLCFFIRYLSEKKIGWIS